MTPDPASRQSDRGDRAVEESSTGSCSLYYEDLIGHGADVRVGSGVEYTGDGGRPVVDVHVQFGPGSFGFTLPADEAREFGRHVQQHSEVAREEAAAEEGRRS